MTHGNSVDDVPSAGSLWRVLPNAVVAASGSGAAGAAVIEPGVAEGVPEPVQEHVDAALATPPGDDRVDAAGGHRAAVAHPEPRSWVPGRPPPFLAVTESGPTPIAFLAGTGPADYGRSHSREAAPLISAHTAWFCERPVIITGRWPRGLIACHRAQPFVLQAVRPAARALRHCEAFYTLLRAPTPYAATRLQRPAGGLFGPTRRASRSAQETLQSVCVSSNSRTHP
jgi:hypothetical protein